MNQTYAIVARKTGKIIAEVGHGTACSVNQQYFEAMPMVSWLQRYNRLVKAAGGCEPSNEQFRDAMFGGLGADA